jgi:hypothetical protein
MRRVKDYIGVLAWQSGLGYIALWAIAYWSLDRGPTVFGHSAVCHPDNAQVLFYWVCDPDQPLAILAAVVNAALTVTVWAPVYIAAATVRPEAIAIAVPIVAAHVVGLPAALFVMIRVMLKFFELVRRAFAFASGRPAAANAAAAEPLIDAPSRRAMPSMPMRFDFRQHNERG